MRARSPRSDMSPLNYYPNYSTNYIMLANKRIPATTILYQPCFSATQIDLVLSSCHLDAKRPPSLPLSLSLVLAPCSPPRLRPPGCTILVSPCAPFRNSEKRSGEACNDAIDFPCFRDFAFPWFGVRFLLGGCFWVFVHPTLLEEVAAAGWVVCTSQVESIAA